MSPFFIEEFRKSHQCSACGQRRQENRKFCERHRRERRLAFLARGLCPQCGGNRPVLEGRNRCADCTLYMSQFR